MVWMRTEAEADALINKMKSKNSGNYITQGVAFNKNSESQMQLLKLALMYSYSFGGMIKELLNEKFSNNEKEFKIDSKEFEKVLNIENNFKGFERIENNFEKEEATVNRSVGNFL